MIFQCKNIFFYFCHSWLFHLCLLDSTYKVTVRTGNHVDAGTSAQVSYMYVSVHVSVCVCVGVCVCVYV